MLIFFCERSFSELKSIKNYLRQPLGQQILSNTATLSIENDVYQQVDSKNVIDEFASILSQKIKIVIHSGSDVNKKLKIM